MGKLSCGAVVLSALLCALASAVRADQEASNTARITTDEFGRCYARSVPKHDYDPWDEPRQQGATTTFYVTKDGDIPVDRYDWYSHAVMVKCTLGASGRTSEAGTPLPLVTLVRFGPWHRTPPKEEHLAVAFYTGGKLLKSYTTFDIAGEGKAPRQCQGRYENMVRSVSHYWVFREGGDRRFGEIQIDTPEGRSWIQSLELVTVDGRKLFFRLDTGELVKSEKTAEPDEALGGFNPC